MSETITAAPGDWSDRLFDKARSLGRKGIGKLNHWRRQQDQSALEKSLARIIEVANGHKAKGLAKGSPAYVVLRDQANARILTFASKWKIDVAVIEAQAPALAELRSMCIPDRQTPAGIKLLVALVGAIFSLVLVGAASGLIHAGHDWVMHLIAR
jgi:hypothetical protein